VLRAARKTELTRQDPGLAKLDKGDPQFHLTKEEIDAVISFICFHWQYIYIKFCVCYFASLIWIIG
jgi:hypothetical protein